MADRFELEQQMMNCWHVTDDIDLVATMISESAMKAEDQDKFMNVLIGMRVLYNARFDVMFRTFEELIREGNFKKPHWNWNHLDEEFSEE